MYKLLIADDEPKIRRGLKKLLESRNLGIEVIGEAEDGEVAAEMVKLLKPDIILLDICMPFLNGIEFIKRVALYVENCKIIIITGHDEFQFAQEAIKLGVFDYILKPVVRESLESSINKAIEQLEHSQSKKKYFEWASRQLNNNINAIKDAFFNRWIKSNLSKEEIESQLDFFKIKTSSTLGLCLINPLNKSGIELPKSMDRGLLVFAIKNIAAEFLSSSEIIGIFNDDEGNIVILVNITGGSSWINLGMEIKENINKYLKHTVIFEQEEITQGITFVHAAYSKLLDAINDDLCRKPIVLLILQYINSSYHINDFNIENIAQKFSISTSYVTRLLKQEIGVSFIDYLTSIRIRKAISIIESDPTVKMYEIAEAVGYSNQHYFSKAFKKVIGLSPGEYKGKRGGVA